MANEKNAKLNEQELKEAASAANVTPEPAPAADAAFEVGKEYNAKADGFRYLRGKDGENYALLTGTANGKKVSAIIGSQEQFPMTQLFQIKQASGIRVSYSGSVETTNNAGTTRTYERFQLIEILF